MGAICLSKLQTGPTGKVVHLKGGSVFSKDFQLDRTDPLIFVPKLPEILVERIMRNTSSHSQGNFTINPQREDTEKRGFSKIINYKSHPSGISNSPCGKGVSPLRFDEVLPSTYSTANGTIRNNLNMHKLVT